MALSFDYGSPAPDTLSKGWVSPDMAVVKNALTQGAKATEGRERVGSGAIKGKEWTVTS